MRILSIECSAEAASAAAIENGLVLKENITLEKRTHSETLLPITDSLLKDLNLSLDDFDIFAASKGPGSFTGLRIGLSLIKGFAFKNNTPCFCGNTLDVIAYGEKLRLEKELNTKKENSSKPVYVVSLIDARVNRFYTAVYKILNNSENSDNSDNSDFFEKLTDDSVLPFEEIFNLVKTVTDGDFGSVIFAGDGARQFVLKCNESSLNANIKSTQIGDVQKASALGLLCYKNKTQTVTPNAVAGYYLIKSQAERERLKKLNEK